MLLVATSDRGRSEGKERIRQQSQDDGGTLGGAESSRAGIHLF